MEGGHRQLKRVSEVVITRPGYTQWVRLNIFTGDEGNEGARKAGGWVGKNCFSNYDEVIKKILEM